MVGIEMRGFRPPNSRGSQLLTWAAACVSLVAQAQEGAPPKVTRVVLYPDRAMITRSVEVPCGTSASPAAFRGLPPSLDTSTLQASANGPEARVEGVSIAENVRRDPYSAEVRDLDKKLDDLRAKIRDSDRERERAMGLRQRSESLRVSEIEFVDREAAAEKKPDTARWKEGLESSRVIVAQADQRRLAAEVARRDLLRRLDEVQRKRDALASAAPARSVDAEVLVRCGRSGSAHVDLSYMEGGVSWKPVYEARSEAARKSVELSLLAEVVQATGEAWHGVEVTLSTAVTRRNARPPEPKRLYLGATPQTETKKVLVRHDVEAEHLESTGSNIPVSGKPAGGENAPVAMTEEGLSVRMAIPDRVDLPGDGRPARLLVQKANLPGTFGLVCIPKLVPYVFRSAEAVNGAAFPLLAGRVDLFSGGDYIGSSDIPRTAQGDKLKLAFGIDEGVKVKRVVLEEEKKDPGFLGSTRRFLYGYRIELSSFEAVPVEVKLQEHIPVAELDDVKVSIGDKSTSGYDLAKDDGILTWKVSLSPGQKREIELHFSIDIPEKYDSTGL